MGTRPLSPLLQELTAGDSSWEKCRLLPTLLFVHSHKQLEQLEGKRSGLAKELVEVREALSSTTLQRDMLQAEKAEVAEALTKVRPICPTNTDQLLPFVLVLDEFWLQADL